MRSWTPKDDERRRTCLTPGAERHRAPLKAAEKIPRLGRPVPVESRERPGTGGQGRLGEM